ncbi:DUF881 domain-containing protein [Nocardioides sp. zg-536]|uniref:DUF881 domain-containing protein n=1 Tax=Nocardioides faecalis TaxID=2803858 RepID=A0A938Y4K2_9ACTN|nr:DUF881 domain-containing protein [Nocardioides faecalis]MBM9459119.1 DUF881 domain-containing protein [Nocardioides faecalis]QVI57376.1 DUF881 domain-containing protein [Nocardioides faecalis]
MPEQTPDPRSSAPSGKHVDPEGTTPAAEPIEEPVEEPAEQPVEEPTDKPTDKPDEAPAPPPLEERSAPDRIRQALLRPTRQQLVAAVLLGLLGFAAVTQVRVTGTEDNYAGLRQQELIDLLNGLAGTRQRTEAEIERLEEAAGGLRDDTTRRQTALDQAQDTVDSLSILAGLVPVTGPGIRITITEVDGRVSLGSVIDTVQELRSVGAEAMSINGKVRVVAQTAFEVTDSGFLAGGEEIEAPYVIDVIGDPAALSSAISFALGPKKQIEEDGARVEVVRLDTVDIEEVTSRDEPRYAVPDPGQ